MYNMYTYDSILSLSRFAFISSKYQNVIICQFIFVDNERRERVREREIERERKNRERERRKEKERWRV